LRQDNKIFKVYFDAASNAEAALLFLFFDAAAFITPTVLYYAALH
jgi:hypothetical protein